MTIVLDILAGIGLWLLAILVLLSLARAAADADERLGYKAPASPIWEQAQEWLAARERTLKRQGIEPIETFNRPRLGIDHVKRGRGA